jgi:outer membrane protein insertion porin family
VNKFGSNFIFSDGFTNNINAKINISRNSVDKPIFETSGSKITFSAQLTPPYSVFNNKDYRDLTDQDRYKFLEYQKYKFSAAWYTSLTNKRSAEGKEARNLVLYTKAGYGFLGMYNSQVGLSPFERFSLGGSGLTGFNLVGKEIIALRGYDDNSLSPNTGSAFVNKYTMELRFPLSLNPQATIYMLGFAEAGNAWSQAKDYNPFQLKRSAGVGLRIFLPMFGLLGFDYGWRFDDVPTNTGMQKSQFHFTIGAALGEL